MGIETILHGYGFYMKSEIPISVQTEIRIFDFSVIKSYTIGTLYKTKIRNFDFIKLHIPVNTAQIPYYWTYQTQIPYKK